MPILFGEIKIILQEIPINPGQTEFLFNFHGAIGYYLEIEIVAKPNKDVELVDIDMFYCAEPVNPG